MAERFRHEIGRRLRNLRKEKALDISPEDLAAQAEERGIKLKSRTIRVLEKGERNPGVETLRELLRFYGLSLGEFFAFTVEDDYHQLTRRFQQAIKNDSNRKALKAILDTYVD